MADSSDSASSSYSLSTDSEFSLTGDWSDCSQEAAQSQTKSKHLITPGVSKLIFRALKKKAAQIPAKERLCVLLLHEIDIDPHMNYLPREDYIIGFEDFGWERRQKIADNAAVFMLRSIYGGWKQPVAFAFYDWPLNKFVIAKFLKEIVKETKAAGLNLISFVCTHAAGNLSALDALRKETKAEQADDNVLIVAGQEIVPIFDPCTLLCTMRNNMLEHDLVFKKDGVSKVAKWTHIQEAYEIDCDLTQYLAKLTEKHVVPDKIDQKNITSCVQVFSSSVAGFLKTISGKSNDKTSKILPTEVTETADLIFFLDRIFDSVNGGFSEINHKALRGLVTGKSPHSEVWLEGKQMFANMKFLNDDPKYPIRVLDAWPRTLDGFELIKKKLAKLGYDSFPARAFNLDPLENCFDLMREWVKKKRNQNLTCRRFSVFYNKALDSKDVSGCHAADSKCEADGLTFLVTTKDFPQEKKH